MIQLNEQIKDVVVSRNEYKRLLGFPDDYDIEGSDQDLIGRMGRAREWFNTYGKPWTFTHLIENIDLSDDHVSLDGVRFVSSKLREKLAQAKAHSVVLVAISAGPEAEAHAAAHWQEGEPDNYFFMEMYASGVVEALVTQVGAQLCGWAEQNGDKVLPHYSPGYEGWDVADQNALYDLFSSSPEKPLSDRLEILSSGMLKPKKSLIGLFGITDKENVAQEVNSLIPCEQCSLENCAYRRRAYVPANYTIEGIRVAGEMVEDTMGHPSPLTADATYAYSKKALKKWCANYLDYEIKPDGTVEAKFSFEGSTCSNTGIEIKYDFRVRLSSPQEGYSLEEMACLPTGKDDGYTYQCRHVTHADLFAKDVAGHKPLLGESLDEVLTWEPDMVPSGCLCDAESRDHKWKIVLQTLHYRLMHD